MRMHLIRPPIFATLLAMFAVCGAAAEGPSPTETRMRETLRATMLQLRDVQTQLANLQATQATLEQENKDLKAKVEKLTKEGAADREQAKRRIDELDGKLAAKTTDSLALEKSLDEWKSAQKQTAVLAEKTEAERQRLANLAIALQRRVADQQTKNAEMFRLGNEILTRFEKFSFGSALAAREPFIGTTRVKLQGLFQEYQDNLVDARVTPPSSQTLRKEAGLPPKDAAPQAKRDPEQKPSAGSGQKPKP